MADLTDVEYEAASERGRIDFETQPHAESAHYNRRSGMVVLKLYNGCVFSFPPRQLQGLENASDEELEQVELIGMGYGVHWESLDADFTVPGLMVGRFGNAAFMARWRARLSAIFEEALNRRRDAA